MYYYIVDCIFNDVFNSYTPNIPVGISWAGYRSNNQFLIATEQPVNNLVNLTENELIAKCEEWGLNIDAVKSWSLS